MALGPRLRRGLRRSSLLFWCSTLAVAGTTGLFVSHQVGEASARAARLGGLREVPVAARPIAAGKVLQAADVVMRHLPAAALPDGAPARSPAGRSALVPVAAGEVLLASKLAPDGVQGVAALLPAGMKALAVPVDPAATLALQRGHHVDILATFDVEVGADRSAGDAGAPTFAVATHALVLDAGEESVTIAVSTDEALRVAFAISRGTVTLALTQGPSTDSYRKPEAATTTMPMPASRR